MFSLPTISLCSCLQLPRLPSQNLLKHRCPCRRHLLDSSSPSKIYCGIGIPSADCCMIWPPCRLWVVVDARRPSEIPCPSLQPFLDRHLLTEGLFVALVLVAGCRKSTHMQICSLSMKISLVKCLMEDKAN
jgi:hypothetical protein